MTLPVKQDRTVVVSSEETKSMNVLYVDDDRSVREAVVDFLTDKGHSVVQASYAAQARELFNATPDVFDLVLTDFDMPGENGAQFLASIELPQGCERAIITGGEIEGADGVRAKAASCGITHLVILGKQFDLADLVKRMERLVERHL